MKFGYNKDAIWIEIDGPYPIHHYAYKLDAAVADLKESSRLLLGYTLSKKFTSEIRDDQQKYYEQGWKDAKAKKKKNKFFSGVL